MKTLVAGFFLDREEKHIYYILKDKSSVSNLNGKLTGVGGHIEPTDNSPLDALFREVREELKINITHLDTLSQRGYFIDRNGILVYLFTGTLPFSLAQRYIEDEGWLVKKPLNYHEKHPEEFPQDNPEVIIKLLREPHKKFSLDFRGK